jgi:hypothetical protein
MLCCGRNVSGEFSFAYQNETVQSAPKTNGMPPYALRKLGILSAFRGSEFLQKSLQNTNTAIKKGTYNQLVSDSTRVSSRPHQLSWSEKRPGPRRPGTRARLATSGQVCCDGATKARLKKFTCALASACKPPMFRGLRERKKTAIRGL